MAIESLGFESGFIVITEEGGQRTRQPISEVLRALDIPTGITHTQVTSLKALANLIVILIRTLIDRDILSDTFLEEDDIDLDTIILAVSSMGGDFNNPDLDGATT